MIYLDSAASAPLLPEVKETLSRILDIYANPSSLHAFGLQAGSLINQSSDTIAKCLNCEPWELHYTSGATMSNNIAIQGFLKKHKGCRVITSMLEHDEIHLMLNDYPKDLIEYIPCDKNGKLDLAALKIRLIDLTNKNPTPILLSLQWANNETGVIQDMDRIANIADFFSNVYLHSDCTQYIPHYKIDLKKLKIDMLSCSSQKLGGLKGCGLLYVRDGIELAPILYGDQGLIGGTENVPGIVCMAEAFRHIDESVNYVTSAKRDYLYTMLADCGELVGTLEDRLPNNLCMIFPEVKGEQLQALLSDRGIYVSTGSACSSHTDQPSRTLTAMGYSKEQAGFAIRFSLPDSVSFSELDQVSNYVHQFVELLQKQNTDGAENTKTEMMGDHHEEN